MKKYYLDEIKIEGFEPNQDYKDAMKRQREGTLTADDYKLLLNKGYKIKQEGEQRHE